MKFLYITFALLFICEIGLCQMQAEIGENEQQLVWTGKAAVGGFAPEGTLDILSASMTYTTDQISTMNIVVDMRSLKQENTQLSGHLKEKDFFHVKKFPVATFVLTEGATIENGNAKLVGRMTIRGKIQQEEIPATVSISESVITVTFDHTLDRTRYGVNYNSPSIFKKIKENAIADDFELRGVLHFSKL